MIKTLNYFGGKVRSLNHILPILESTPHTKFIDLFGGGGSVITHKRPRLVEYYNDIDNELYNFFTIAREQPEELTHALNMTPYSRQEYEKSKQLLHSNPIERARRLFVLLNQSANGRRNNGYWLRHDHKNPAQGTRPKTFYKKVDSIQKLANRFKNVYIENQDAIDLFLYLDCPHTLTYADPPYVPETRTAVKYAHDIDEDYHIELLTTFKSAAGKVAISGYDSDLYNDMLSGWNCERWQMGTQGSKDGKTTIKTECLWYNYNVPKQGRLL